MTTTNPDPVAAVAEAIGEDIHKQVHAEMMAEYPDGPPLSVFVDEVNRRHARAAIQALATIAPESVVALVKRYGDLMKRVGSVGVDEYHKGISGTQYSSWAGYAKDAESAEAALLATASSLSARVVTDGYVTVPVDMLNEVLAWIELDEHMTKEMHINVLVLQSLAAPVAESEE